jgi:EAL domain-containing protein (putative c-di-GMP-specific phosphodiesterase class I)
MENDLRKALKRNEFRIYYQPKVEVLTKKVTGAEALIRWQHPSRGIIAASEFIPLAEETGLMRSIVDWVLRRVCEQNIEWQKSGFVPLPVAVNLSNIQFRQKDLKLTITEILAETGMDPSFLELEITESAIMHNEEESAISLRELSALGIKLSIDDFGTGYSSLSRLKRFKLDALKIDKSFVLDLDADPENTAITKAIIAMARSLEMKVIAEGVETEQQLKFLRNQGCDEVQGYLFSRPLPAHEFAPMLGSTGAEVIKFPHESLHELHRPASSRVLAGSILDS